MLHPRTVEGVDRGEGPPHQGQQDVGIGTSDRADRTLRCGQVDRGHLGVGQGRVELLEQCRALTQGGQHRRLGHRQRAHPFRGDEDLPPGDDRYEGVQRSGDALRQVEQASHVDLHQCDQLVVVGLRLLDRAGQVQQRRQVGGQQLGGEVGDDGRGQVQRHEDLVQVPLDRFEDRVGRVRPHGGAHAGAKGGGSSETIRHRGGVLASTDDEMCTHERIRPRRAS